MNETIGSADIAESDEEAVIDLISAWHDNAAKPLQPTSQATDLGLGKPLPPLPSPNECFQLTFRPPRWTKAAARAWAAMHGFRMTNILTVDGNVRVSVHPLERFVPGRFQNVAISADITATVGLRKPSPKASPARKVAKPGASRSTRRAAPRSPMLRGR